MTHVTKMKSQIVIKQVVIALCLYLGFAIFGVVSGWPSPVIPKLQDPEQTPLPEVITDTQASWIASLTYIGSVVCPFVTGYLSNSKGRKPSILIGGIGSLMGMVLVAAAQNFAMILVGRFMCGVGMGIAFIVNFVYIGEIASTNIRGVLLTGAGIFMSLGTLLIFSVGHYVSYVGVSMIGVVISSMYVVTVYFCVPESPVFHVLKGRSEEARLTLISLGREEDVQDLLSTEIEPESSVYKDWKDLFIIKSNRKAFIIILILHVLQHMSGVGSLVSFATTIFGMANSSLEPHVSSIIVAVIQFISSIVCPSVIERSGRKILLLISTLVCSICLAALGTYFYLDSIGSANSNFNWIPLTAMTIFFLSYNSGFAIIPGTFVGEMFTLNVRSMGATITITTSSIVAFGVVTAFGYINTAAGIHVSFWIFSASSAVAFLFTLFYTPETKGKSLLEIQELLGK